MTVLAQGGDWSLDLLGEAQRHDAAASFECPALSTAGVASAAAGSLLFPVILQGSLSRRSALEPQKPPIGRARADADTAPPNRKALDQARRKDRRLNTPKAIVNMAHPWSSRAACRKPKFVLRRIRRCCGPSALG